MMTIDTDRPGVTSPPRRPSISFTPVSTLAPQGRHPDQCAKPQFFDGEQSGAPAWPLPPLSRKQPLISSDLAGIDKIH
ncbi:hypothetical protein OG552_17910 [Streptomyces sp. NBC_01476]|uniref:hypothetical protein n=1 Tax=Streptomyces sp. NBC_01476 TaxID=2903881 RepID=UPI002E375EC8|nr:hypothetical protein [Streptomyces sp. NBC_01476]